MKTTLSIAIAASLVLPLSAGFDNWTNKDGKAAQLDLMEVTGEGDAKAGVFMMRNGRKVTIKAADLSETDAKRLAEWKPEPAASDHPSVFDDMLDGNLLILDGKKLEAHEPASKPSKYYIFYYTASWCGPCQAFTPSLVSFYNKHKSEKFELVLITSDEATSDMEKYASAKKMPWPQLKQSKVASFEKKFNHGVTGIPSVITCDLEGKVISRTEDLRELEKLIK